LEDFIEGAIDSASYLHITKDFDRTRRSRFPKCHTPDDDAWQAVYCAVHRWWLESYDHFAEGRWRAAMAVARDAAYSTGSDEKSAQSNLVRDIFGNPFRRVTVSPFVQKWNDSVVIRLAQAAYEEQHLPAGTLDSSRLAILADALEEAGCTDADILGHLRGPGPHVRGCWPVDLCL
jgi:hypothetical protein